MKINIRERKFKYGPIAIGIYHALITLTILVFMFARDYVLYYLAFLLFLPLGLRPLLERTRLYDLFQHLLVIYDEKRDEKWLVEHRRKVERKERDAMYRKQRHKDKRLPKNW